TGGDKSKDPQTRLQKGVSTGKSAVERLGGRRLTAALMGPVLAAVRVRYQLGLLEPVKQGNFWAVHGELQRMTVVTNQPTHKTMGKAEKSALRGLHDKVGRILNSEIAKALKKSAVIKKLSADATLKGQIDNENTQLLSAWTHHESGF